MAPFNNTSRGLPQVVLVILLAWALTAVLIFTGILVNAREIDRRVVYINSVLTPINQHTGYIALAGKTAVISGKILTAAAPLAAGLQKTSDSVKSIDKTVKQILATAKQIGIKVVPIGATVGTIHATVLSINSTVSSIHTAVVGSITPKLATTGRNVTSIGSTVGSIRSTAGSILTTARAIQQQVTPINDKAATIQGAVDGPGKILPNFVAINATVGRAPSGTTINGHANSIDCSTLFNLPGQASITVNLVNILVAGGPDAGCGK